MSKPTAPRKLIIQIPCYNEEGSLLVTLKALPSSVSGYDSVEILVIDDGSTDKTVEVARAHGVAHIVSHGYNKGLARAFMTGLDEAVRQGAHTIVNLDADNQYCADDIPLLVEPILAGKALVVIGTRPILSIQHFSTAKKIFQRFGSWVVRVISKTTIQDVPSGFRAIHRDVAKQINILSTYTYTIEMIIQLGYKNIPMICVPIRVNAGELRPSRLISSNLSYILKSAQTIMYVFVLYRPMLFFSSIASVLFAICAVIASRYLHFMFIGQGVGHVQSLLLSIVLAVSGVTSLLIGLVCDSIRANRLLLEDIRYRLLTLAESDKNE